MKYNLKGRKVLVMGGTRISCEIIRKAREMGCYVAVADYNTVEDSPGKQIADEYFNVSVTDIEAMVDLVEKEHIEGILVGFSDMLLPYYAEICRKTGLPSYATKEQFEIFTNKDRYKELCRKFDVPTIEEYKVDLNNFDITTKEIKYPVLVKPADSSGARGITVCNSKADLKNAIENAKKYSHTGTVLVERYLEGREVTVFWLFQDGKYYLTAIGNRHVKQNQEGVIPLPVGYTFPSAVTPDYQKNIEENCKKMFRHAGIQNGMMFMQCKVKNNVCIVYDIGYRLTGSLEYKILKEVCDYDPLEMLINFAVTGKMSTEDLSEKVDPFFNGEYAYNVSCLAMPGTIKSLSGREAVLKMPGVIDVVTAHYPGETITENMKGLLAQITVRILGTAKKEEDLYQTMKEIENTIHIISTKGNEMMLPGIEIGDIENYCIHTNK